ncbi:DUF4352 domain-containing protein [Desulfobacter latus]|uniref:DUF4352 domain-containing protein n=1 Tax=Desulfobacter latus TaxID=2292 RepID=A0A850T058_9BACT|nr:DUF4352 domain-containing protein [Desulfobacter latus]NWH06899.1 DUF4352 domain-containing protein [Desulfobacter latus]
MLKYSYLMFFLSLFIASPSYPFLKCVNDKGELAFTDTICPAGYKQINEYNEKKKTPSSPAVPIPNNENAQNIINNINFRVIQRKKVGINNQYEQPQKGNIFLACLIQINNRNKNTTIYGGSSDHHDTFTLKTNDGYTIKAVNTSSAAWREALKVWTGINLYPGEQGKGWIVFEIPKRSTPKKLYFHVCKVNSPHNLTELGRLSIDF